MFDTVLQALTLAEISWYHQQVLRILCLKALILVFKFVALVNSADNNSDRLFYCTQSCNFLQKQCLLEEKLLVMFLLICGF